MTRKRNRLIACLLVVATVCTCVFYAAGAESAAKVPTPALTGDDLFLFEHNEAYGYMDREGNIIRPKI